MRTLNLRERLAVWIVVKKFQSAATINKHAPFTPSGNRWDKIIRAGQFDIDVQFSFKIAIASKNFGGSGSALRSISIVLVRQP